MTKIKSKITSWKHPGGRLRELDAQALSGETKKVDTKSQRDKKGARNEEA